MGTSNISPSFTTADDPPSPSPSPLPHRPQPVREGESTTLSPQACRRCRKKKLACSRELPICKRCGRIAAICEYPPPPDRKALAAIRSRNALARAQGEAGSSSGLPEQQQFPVDAGTWSLQQRTSSIGLGDHATNDTAGPEAYARHQQRSQSGSVDYRDLTPPLQPLLRKTTLPSSEVTVFLFEIYFSRIYSASLLFHKEKFLSDYTAGNVPDSVALSIFACSCIFFRQSPGRPRQDNGEDEATLGISMLSVADSTKQGLEWATAASQRVLMQADVPCLHTIQACQNLVLYWFAAGEGDRAHIHAHLAYRTALLLNLHVQKKAGDQIEGSELADELGRRCFWSCWITSCISQDNAVFKSVPSKEAVGLMFPSDEGSWASRKPISTEFFNDSGGIESNGSLSFDQQPSVMGEMVKACCLWWEIQHSIKQYKDTKSGEFSARVAAHLELDTRLRLVFENLHPNLRYQNASSFKSGKLDPYKLVSLHSLYNLCFCALHSSIVPVFSDFVKNPAVSGSLLRLSALESVNHAVLILDMATTFMNNRLETSRLPSIVGYAMFVASTIHFKSLVAQRKLRAHGLARFKAAVSILERLKEYWVPLRGLWSVLESVAASHRVDINTISMSDIRIQRNPEEEFTDVERIASHERLSQDAGSTDIYTYVPDDVTKNASPRRHSHSPAHTTQKTSKSSPLSTNITADSTPAQYGQEINVTPAVRQTTLGSSTFTLPHQQLHTPQSFPSQQNHELEQMFIANPQSMPPDMGRTNVGVPSGFTPLESTSEEYQMQGQTAGPSHISATQPLVEIGSLSESIDIAMTDGTYTWWDQPFESFEVDSNQLNHLQEGGVFPFNTFSFGPQS